MKMTSSRSPVPTPARSSAPGRGELAGGYLTSSYELQAGLEVRALAPHQIPAEVLGELMRLHRSWAGSHPG